jgi:serine/threonine protein kinase
LLLDSNNNVKLSDYGFSSIKATLNPTAHIEIPYWLAPELLSNGALTEKADGF